MHSDTKKSFSRRRVVRSVAVDAGMMMILLRFITVCGRTEDVHARRLNWVALLVGLLATILLSFVANFPEDQSHGVGTVHEVTFIGVRKKVE